MAERLQKMGLHPHKAWTFANGEPLYAPTKHVPSGFVTWGYHVAPTLRVRKADGKGADELVLDPSLFDRPVTLIEWKNGQKRRADSHDPYVRVSQVGKPPAMPHHENMHGTGYWPSDDPPEELTHYSLRVMRVFKRFENHQPPKNLHIPPEVPNNRARAVGDRLAWLHPQGFFRQVEGKNWVERDSETHRFLQETARTADWIELQDDSHKVQIRLTRERALSRASDKEPWLPAAVGCWEDPMLVPLDEMTLPDARAFRRRRQAAICLSWEELRRARPRQPQLQQHCVVPGDDRRLDQRGTDHGRLRSCRERLWLPPAQVTRLQPGQGHGQTRSLRKQADRRLAGDAARGAGSWPTAPGPASSVLYPCSVIRHLRK